MRLIIIALLAGLMFGCAAQPEYGKPNKYLVIKLVIDDDLSWMGLDKPGKKVTGYADCKNGICTLYLPSDRSSLSDCIWLHEFRDHAVYNMKHDKDYIAC